LLWVKIDPFISPTQKAAALGQCGVNCWSRPWLLFEEAQSRSSAPSCKYLRRLDGKFFVVDEDGFASKLCLCLLASSVPVTVLLLRTKNHGAFSTLPVAPASSVNCEFCIFFIRGVYCFRVNYHLFEGTVHTNYMAMLLFIRRLIHSLYCEQTVRTL
jgi:hypothetical protein